VGLFEQVAQALRGPGRVERFARGQAAFEDPGSADGRHWNDVVAAAPQEDLQHSLTEAARQVAPQEYDDHITPGARGTDPLGALSGGSGLAMLGGALLRNLSGGSGALAGLIPGLQTGEPKQMAPGDLASLAKYMRQRQPEAFGRAAAEVGRQRPGLLQSLLGNKALMLGAAVLGANAMSACHRAA
jgi:hypothetical protein